MGVCGGKPMLRGPSPTTRRSHPFGPHARPLEGLMQSIRVRTSGRTEARTETGTAVAQRRRQPFFMLLLAYINFNLG